MIPIKRFCAFHFLFPVILFIFFVLSACETGVKKDVHPLLRDVSSIAVFPFVCMDCSIPTDGLDEKTIGGDASPVMTDHLVNRLRERTNLDVSLMSGISKEKIESVFSGSWTMDPSIRKDAVFFGRIFHYKDRKGGDYAVSEPSRVAFDMRIIRISDGLVLFHSEFDETQKPLLSNVMNIKSFLKREGRWIEAEEMAKTAIDDALEDFFTNR